MKRALKLIKIRTPSRDYSSRIRKDVWTSPKIIKSPCEDIAIPKMLLNEYFWRSVDKWPTKVATVCGVTDRKYTYEQLHKRARVFGASLRKKFKIDNGDTVGIMMRNAPEYATVTLGAIASGAVVTTFNPVYTAHEISSLLKLSQTKLIIAEGELVAVIRDALEIIKMEIPTIVMDVEKPKPDGTISYKELVEDQHIDLSVLKDVKRTPDDVVLLPYSSGTTGFPKCVELTHFNVVANCEQQNSDYLRYHSDTETYQDTIIAALPLFHSYGLGILMLHKLQQGLKMVTLPKFEPNSFLNALTKYRVSILHAAPPLILYLGSNPSVTSKNLEHLKVTICGAAPLPPTDIQNYLAKSRKDSHFCQGYGMTEASPLVTISPLGLKKYETVGYSLPNIDLRVVDSQMNNLGPDEVGELLIKGPNTMKGYKNNPVSTAESFVEDRWYRSGDMAKIDRDGLITISDRLKELIKVNAFQVPPAELEYVLKDHPDVFDAAVIGIPDANTGERPKAFIVLNKNAKSTDKEIMAFVDARVAKFKRIKEIAFVDSIPKNPSGKILRKKLRELYC